MDKTDILEFLKTIASIVLQTLFIFYIDKLANSLMIAIVAYVVQFIVWNQIAINHVLDKTGLDITNPNHFEEISRYAIEEKNRLWPWIAVSWLIVPTMYELLKIVMTTY